jgi:predicted porin
LIGSTYYLYSDGSVNATGTLTAAQIASGVTVVGNSGAVTAANFLSVCGTASATSPLYPTSRTWTVDQKDRNDVIGLGMKYDFGKAKLDLDYTYTKGKTSISYGYNPTAQGFLTSGTAPTAAQLLTLSLIGSGYSDIVYEVNAIDASVLVPISKMMSLRFLGHYEKAKIHDWHYDGVAAYPSPAANQQTYLDSGPQNYDVTMIGVLLKVDF